MRLSVSRTACCSTLLYLLSASTTSPILLLVLTTQPSGVYSLTGGTTWSTATEITKHSSLARPRQRLQCLSSTRHHSSVFCGDGADTDYRRPFSSARNAIHHRCRRGQRQKSLGGYRNGSRSSRFRGNNPLQQPLIQRTTALAAAAPAASDNENDNSEEKNIGNTDNNEESQHPPPPPEPNETQRLLELQQKQIDMLVQLVNQQQQQPQPVTAVPPLPNPQQTQIIQPDAISTSTVSSPGTSTATGTAPLKAMLFVDGTWLYYSIYERSAAECPLAQRHGRGWPFRYQIDWAALPRSICEALQDPGWSSSSGSSTAAATAGRSVEIVRVNVFTSFKADTPKDSWRFRMFQDMVKANYDVNMMETVGKAEKCVDIALAVDMLHHATMQPAVIDVALLLTGDKDFIPAMERTRQKGTNVGLVSMKRSCNRALYRQPGLRDYDVVWLDDCLPNLMVPKQQHLQQQPSSLKNGDAEENNIQLGHGYDTPLLSYFTLMKVTTDFIRESDFDQVSSRDIGRYLKFLKFGNSNMLDELKRCSEGLKHFLSTSGVFVVQDRDRRRETFREDKTDNAYWVGLTPDADITLLTESKRVAFTPPEKNFFSDYSLEILHSSKRSCYYHTLLMADNAVHPMSSKGKYQEKKPEAVLDIPEDLTRDYEKSGCTVAELKNRCRERGLKVTGTKTALLERIAHDAEQEIARLKQEFLLAKRQEEPLTFRNQFPTATTADERMEMVATEKHLKALIAEYLQAAGGKASSRDVGRYLAANRPSSAAGINSSSSVVEEVNNSETTQGAEGQQQSPPMSALAELKNYFGNLANFVSACPESFDKLYTYDNKNVFGIALRELPTQQEPLTFRDQFPAATTANERMETVATEKHLKALIAEYLQAAGGKASSRDVGRYLAANRPSSAADISSSSSVVEEVNNSETAQGAEGQQQSPPVSALAELKSYFGNLASFVSACPESFHKLSTYSNDKNEFGIALREPPQQHEPQ